MRLLTYGDDPSKVKYLKSNFENIGLRSPYMDLFSKFEAFHEWFRRETPPDDEIIVFVDGYDVVQKRTDLHVFEEEFKKFKADIVFSAETNCWPNKWMQELFPHGPSRYRWPNSGTFVGRAWAIRKMLDYGPYRINFDDQGYVHDFFLRGKAECVMKLDYFQILFQTGTGVEWNVIDATTAWFVHFNGKSHLDINNNSVLEICASGNKIGNLIRRK